jgi:hypothetical protein
LDGLYQPVDDLEEQISHVSSRVTIGSAVALLVLVVVAALFKDRFSRLKLPLFLGIALIMAGSTLFLAGSTIYVNNVSDSGGPVHWHADLEIWACGNELELRGPSEFFSNKIGTSTLHEHDDKRIHLEGVVIDDSRDASLGKFFHVVDGAITSDAVVVPLNPVGQSMFEDSVDGDGASDLYQSQIDPFVIQEADGSRYFRALSGETCGGETAQLQVFVYKYDEVNDTYVQTKLSSPTNYSIGPYSTVPPGDCIIVEFGAPKDQTNRLCEQYGIRDIDRCQEFGVEPDQQDICTLKQLNYPATDPNQDKLTPTSRVEAPPVLSLGAT